MEKHAYQACGTLPHQNGAALVVALLFLVALTLLGLAAIGGNTLQQKMAYSLSETNRAFQGAESALSSGEAWLDLQTDQPVPDCGVSTTIVVEGVDVTIGTPDACPSVAAIWPVNPLPDTGPRGTSEDTGDDPVLNFFMPGWWTDVGRLFGYSYIDGQTPAQTSGQAYVIGGNDVATSSARYPRYVIEELGKDPSGSTVIGGPKTYTLWYYQITARGTGQIGDSPTLVQSVYTRGF